MMDIEGGVLEWKRVKLTLVRGILSLCSISRYNISTVILIMISDGQAWYSKGTIVIFDDSV